MLSKDPKFLKVLIFAINQRKRIVKKKQARLIKRTYFLEPPG